MKKFISPPTNTQKRKGFTLLEILIAVGIFTVITLLSVGGFLSLSSVQKKVQNSQEVLNEFRFAIDLIGREVMSGYAFTNDCEDGCSSMTFVTRVRPDVPSGVVHYYLDTDTGKIMKGRQKTHGACFDLMGNPPFRDGCYQPFTSDKVYVDSFKFFVSHEGDWTQKAIITLTIEGKILQGTRNEEPFQISSSYSPRLMQDPTATPPTDNVPPEIVITNPVVWQWFPRESDSIPIEGTARDNLAIKEIWWENEESGYTGFAFNTNSFITDWVWEILPFRHLKVGENVINVTAYDKDKNEASDTVTVTRANIISSDLPKPSWARSLYQYCSGADLRVRLTTGTTFDGDKYHAYRCDAGANPGCTPDNWVANSSAPSTRNAYGNATTFEFYTSNDGASWDKITEGDFPIENNEVAVYFEEQQARYIKFVVTEIERTYDRISVNPEITLIQPHGAPVPTAGWSVIDVVPNCSINDTNDFFDRNPMSYWHTGSGCNPDPIPPHSINIDLGMMYTFDRFHYVPSQSLGWVNITDTVPSKGTYNYRMRSECDGRCSPDVYSSFSDTETIVVDLDCVVDPNPGDDDDDDGSDFSITRSPSVIKVGVTGDPDSPAISESTRIKINPSGGFSSEITLSVTSTSLPGVYLLEHRWPNGQTITSENYSTGVRYRIMVKGNTPVSNETYSITIKGDGGGESDTVTVYLLVTDAGGGIE